MKIKDIADYKDTNDTIEALKERQDPAPNIEEILKQYYPREHDIFSKALRKDKPIYKTVEKEDGTTEEKHVRDEPVARIGIGLQQLIVERAVSFLFGNPVNMLADIKEDEKQKRSVYDSVSNILRSNKEFSLNRRVARETFISTESAEYWYSVATDKPHLRYGFPSSIKLRAMHFRPSKGDRLFPLFDESGDMIAFSRGFEQQTKREKVQYFETWTDEEFVRWIERDGIWHQDKTHKITISKIPIVYSSQDETEWSIVDWLISRLEKLLSVFADINDYHGAPKIFTTGTIEGWGPKAEGGIILQGEAGADAKYLSWDHAPESVKLEIDTLFRLIFSLTQTPDISFESVKGLTDLSGVALKLLFTDPHLKVKTKEEIFIEYLQRRYSIVQAYVGEMRKGLSSAASELLIEPEIVPFMIDDETVKISNLSMATGGKPILSQKTAIQQSGLAADPDAEFEQLQEETVGGMEE